MAITFPLALPTVTGLAQIRLGIKFAVTSSTSPWSGTEQIYENQGDIWMADIALPPMRREDGEVWASFLLSLNGRLGTFLMGDPMGATARGAATGIPLVKGAAQTGKTLVTDGWTPDITGILKAGDYIQLGTGSSSHLHKVVQDANSDSGGNATLEIQPRLRAVPSDNDPLVVSACKGLWRLTTNFTPWDIQRIVFYSMSFSAREAI